MTKTDVLATEAGRDHVADLNIAVCNNNPIYQQFDELPLLLKRGCRQAGSHALAKVFNMSNQPR